MNIKLILLQKSSTEKGLCDFILDWLYIKNIPLKVLKSFDVYFYPCRVGGPGSISVNSGERRTSEPSSNSSRFCCVNFIIKFLKKARILSPRQIPCRIVHSTAYKCPTKTTKNSSPTKVSQRLHQ